MSSTFSTVINVSLLSMLQSLHKLAIKKDLESQLEGTTKKINSQGREAPEKKIEHGESQCADTY